MTHPLLELKHKADIDIFGIGWYKARIERIGLLAVHVERLDRKNNVVREDILDISVKDRAEARRLILKPLYFCELADRVWAVVDWPWEENHE